MKKIITSFFIFFTLISSAQVPGYMGKRCYVLYSVWAHPTVKPVTDFFGSPNPYDDISINMTQSVELDYLFKSRAAVCFGFQYSRLPMDYVENSNYTYKGKDNFPAMLNARAFSLGFKIFSRRKIAPIGNYIKGNFFVMYNTLSYDTKGASTTVYGYNGSVYGPQKIPSKSPSAKVSSSGGGAAISLGRQRVFFNRLVVDSGIRFSIAVASEPSSIYANEFSVTDRVFFNQFVNVRLGLGLLAF